MGKKNINIGWRFANPDAKIASVRIRGLNIIDYINKSNNGFNLEIFDVRRLSIYDIVIFSKTYTSNDIDIALKLKKNGQVVFFDICDNHFLLGAERVKLLNQMLSISDRIIVSTDALKEVMVTMNIPETKISVIPDAIDNYNPSKSLFSLTRLVGRIKLSLFFKKLDSTSLKKERRIIWFGNHEGSVSDSGMAHLSKLKDLLTNINEEIPISLTVLSNSRSKFQSIFSTWSIPCLYYEWNILTQEAVLSSHGIAIIPVNLNDFTIVKTNNRVLTSIINGLNVVADEIPSYREFNRCIFLNDWEKGLRTYLTDSQRGREDNRQGREIIEKNYNLNKISNEWIRTFSIR